VGPVAPHPPIPETAAPAWNQRLGREVNIEELFGGRLLAWLGGIAVVLGVVFFVATAIHRGWIDEPTRIALAFLGSTALLVAGLWLHERRGQTQASLAMVAAAIAALYASLTAATSLYDLVSAPLGLAVAALVGGVATAIAVRWSSPVVAGLGLVGALLSPVLVQADSSGVTLLFALVALVATVGVLLWQRWNWLAAAAFLVSLPQLLAWVNDEHAGHLGLVLVVVAAFWALFVVAAIGYELRVPTSGLRTASALLLFVDTAAAGGVGYWVLHDGGHGATAKAWILALAAANVALGAGVPRRRMSPEIGALLIAIGTAVAALGLALALSGPVLVSAWAVEAVLLAWLARRFGDERAMVLSVVYLTAALVHALAFEAPPVALVHGVDDLPRALAALAIAIAGVVGVALFAPRSERVEWRALLTALAAGLGVYLVSVLIVDASGTGQGGQLLLSAFWSVTGLAALVAGLARDDRRLRLGGLGLLGLAIVKVFLYDLATLDSIYRVVSFVAVGLLLLAGAFAYQRARPGGEES